MPFLSKSEKTIYWCKGPCIPQYKGVEKFTSAHLLEMDTIDCEVVIASDFTFAALKSQ